MKKRLLKLLTVASLSIVPVNFSICSIYAMYAMDKSDKSVETLNLRNYPLATHPDLLIIPNAEKTEAIKLIQDIVQALHITRSYEVDVTVGIVADLYIILNGTENKEVFFNIRHLMCEYFPKFLKDGNTSGHLNRGSLYGALFKIINSFKKTLEENKIAQYYSVDDLKAELTQRLNTDEAVDLVYETLADTVNKVVKDQIQVSMNLIPTYTTDFFETELLGKVSVEINDRKNIAEKFSQYTADVLAQKLVPALDKFIETYFSEDRLRKYFSEPVSRDH